MARSEWPTSYVRGCEGLAASVPEVKSLTLGQIIFRLKLTPATPRYQRIVPTTGNPKGDDSDQALRTTLSLNPDLWQYRWQPPVGAIRPASF